jgi:SAM-dependent methyltransferase
MRKIEENYFTQPEVAGAYDSYIGINMPFYWPAIEFVIGEILQRFPQGLVESALEIGVGSGNFSSTLFSQLRVKRLAILDHSAAFLGIAQRKILERLPYFPVAFTSVYQSFADDAWTEFFQSAQTELVISSLTFDHISDESLPDVYRKIHRLLRPGGWFTIAEKCALADRESESWKSYVRSIDIRTQHNRNHRLKSEAELVEWRRHNFEDDQMRSLGHQAELLEQIGFVVDVIGGVPLPAAMHMTYEQFYGLNRIERLTRDSIKTTDQALGIGVLICRKSGLCE